MDPDTDAVTLDELARHLRAQPALAAKAQIGLVRDVLGPASFVEGPGDDGAVVRGSSSDGDAGPGAQVVVCGEAILPAFVAGDPFGAGLAAVLTNVNDLAAMGAVPRGIVDTIVGTAELAREVLRGMREGSALYDVPLVGGHLTVQPGPASVSAFGVGYAEAVLSSTRVEVGQSLVVAGCVEGSMRADFPFFPTFEARAGLLDGDVRLLPRLAASGVCVAAKDVSMAGLVGSLAMLLEWTRLGVTVDLDALPRPRGVPIRDWLTCFPAYCFLLCTPPGRAEDCVAAFATRGLSAAVVGVIDDSGELALRSGDQRSAVLDLSVTDVTGLRR